MLSFVLCHTILFGSISVKFVCQEVTKLPASHFEWLNAKLVDNFMPNLMCLPNKFYSCVNKLYGNHIKALVLFIWGNSHGSREIVTYGTFAIHNMQ